MKGFCTRTIGDEDIIIDEAHPYSFSGKKEDAMTWWEMRPYLIMVPIQSWAEIKSYIIKACKQNNCNQYIKSWDRKINAIDKNSPGG